MRLRRVLVTGGRDYSDLWTVNRWMATADPTVVAQGGASGADRLAALWCHEHGVTCVTYAADWATHGKAAGPIRNEAMLNAFAPDLVLAFAGGTGTANMVKLALAAGVEVWEAT